MDLMLKTQLVPSIFLFFFLGGGECSFRCSSQHFRGSEVVIIKITNNIWLAED